MRLGGNNTTEYGSEEDDLMSGPETRRYVEI